jgi:biopolymer transport protein ExbD
MIEKGAFSNSRSNVSLKKKRILLTSFIVVGYSVSLYLFFLFWREIFRYQTLNEYGEMMILSPAENYFYNFFFAGLAVLTGLSFGADSFFATQFGLSGRVRYSIMNDFSGLQWYCVYIITKLGVFYAIFCWSGELHQAISLYNEYWILFPLILIVLVLRQWINFRRFFKNSFKFMILFIGGVIFFSGILAAIPFFDHQSFNHTVLKHTVNYNYIIDLPDAKSSTGIERRYLTEDLYLGYPKTGKTDSAIVIIAANMKNLSNAELVSWVEESKKLLEEVEVDQFTICLKADKNVKVGTIQNIIETLRENGVRQFYFMATQRQGIRIVIKPTFSEFTKDTTRWHPSYAEYIRYRKDQKIIKVDLIQDEFYVSDSLILKSELQTLLKDFFWKNKGQYSIDINSDDESSYHNLIVFIDQIGLSVIQLRKEFAREHFSKEYDVLNTAWEDRPLHDTLSRVYPFGFNLPNEQERAYLEKYK